MFKGHILFLHEHSQPQLKAMVEFRRRERYLLEGQGH
jgi:hypothetical protein